MDNGINAALWFVQLHRKLQHLSISTVWDPAPTNTPTSAVILLKTNKWCTHTSMQAHMHLNTCTHKPVGDSGTSLSQRSFKPVMWNDPFPSANQITSPSWAEVCKHTPTFKARGSCPHNTHTMLSLIRFCPTNLPVFVSAVKVLASAKSGNTNWKILRGFSKCKVFIDSWLSIGNNVDYAAKAAASSAFLGKAKLLLRKIIEGCDELLFSSIQLLLDSSAVEWAHVETCLRYIWLECKW